MCVAKKSPRHRVNRKPSRRSAKRSSGVFPDVGTAGALVAAKLLPPSVVRTMALHLRCPHGTVPRSQKSCSLTAVNDSG